MSHPSEVYEWLVENQTDAVDPLVAWLVGTNRPSTLESGGMQSAEAGADVSYPIKGIDIYEKNTGFPPFSEMAQAGYAFVFHKASQYRPDKKIHLRWPSIAQAGMLRGAYHLFSHNAGTVEQQVERFGSAVGRLVPGDLGPTLDLEDRTPGLNAAYWAPLIRQFADKIEARLGRQPILYTSRSYWAEFMGNDPDFGQYPLWVVWVNPGAPALPAGWRKWHLWQWHWENSSSPMPPPFKAKDKGVDLNRFNGTIYQLRGMADLGHTAPHRAGSRDCVAYTQADGRIHLAESVSGAWRDQDILSAVASPNSMGALPPAAGDPAALSIGNEQMIIYRDGSGSIHVLTRSLSGADRGWTAAVTGGGGRAVSDPFVVSFQNAIHLVYRDQFDNQVHVMRVNGVWQAENFADQPVPNSPSQISGDAVVYEHEARLHVISRSGKEGHLLDFTAAASSAAPLDLTANARSAGGGNPPAATYRPAVYTPSGQAPRIVFRAVRGDIWQIERNTLAAKNISLDAGHAPPSAGSPTAIVLDRAHILYRTMDGTIIDMYDDAGIWRRLDVCRNAAADPTAFVDSLGHVAVSFRAEDGAIQVARLVSGRWLCETAIQAQTGEAAAVRQSTGEEYASAEADWPVEDVPATPLLHLEKLKIGSRVELLLFPAGSGRYEGFLWQPIHLAGEPVSPVTVELSGRIQMDEGGTLRNYDPAKDGQGWPLRGAQGFAQAKTEQANGPSSSTAGIASIRPDGTFTFSTTIGASGFMRSLILYPRVEFSSGKRLVASMAAQLIDLDAFLTFVDARERTRTAPISHLEFLASVRKVYQGGPADKLQGLFDWVLYHSRKVKPLVAPGSADEKRLKLSRIYWKEDILYVDGVWLDIGHVLTGIEGSPNQEPNKDQNIPVPVRPDLLVTWAGDLGSALQSYIADFWKAVDTGQPLDLKDYLAQKASVSDLIGDMDGINIGASYDRSRSLAENLRAYYGPRSRRRFHEFITNSKDPHTGSPELPLVPGTRPPRLSVQARQAIAKYTHLFLAYPWVTGRLYFGKDPAKEKLVDSIVDEGSPEMDIVVDYFARFLEDGLAREP